MAGKHYGENIIKQYADKLAIDIGKEYSERMLRNMRKFYITFQNQKWKPPVSKLTWSHIIVLLRIKDVNEINYYIEQCIHYNYSRRELEKILKNKEYQRLPNKTKDKLIQQDNLELIDFVKEPIILNKKYNYEQITEYTLKEIILNDLDIFLLQLGDGFSYIGNEYKIKLGDRFNYIDLLFFNIIYNCYFVVELKINEVKKQDIGQIEIYKNYIDVNIKNINQDKTIGIIVVRENNKYIIKYSTDSRISVTTYEVI